MNWGQDGRSGLDFIIKECYSLMRKKTMPLFMIKRKLFERSKSGEMIVILKNVQPQWKNSRVGDEAVLMSGKKRILRKRIVKIHRGSLARILKALDYRRIFPNAETIFEANRMARKIYPEDREFMAFELV